MIATSSTVKFITASSSSLKLIEQLKVRSPSINAWQLDLIKNQIGGECPTIEF